MLDDHALWRDNHVGALQLLGLAAARLPFGVPDPILCGASAVALYTGDLWPVDELQVIAADTRPLTAELFAVGFHWTQCPLYRGKGLWHPQLQIGADVIEDHVSLASAEFLSVLSVTVDWPLAARVGGELASIKVIGIEDLIVDQATDWLARRMPTCEVATKSGVLVTLAQSGVGGRFRGRISSVDWPGKPIARWHLTRRRPEMILQTTPRRG
jgi:hypothetical protein